MYYYPSVPLDNRYLDRNKLKRPSNPPTLFVRILTGAATMENIMEFTLKKNKISKLPYDPTVPLLGIYLEKTKTLIQKDRWMQYS